VTQQGITHRRKFTYASAIWPPASNQSLSRVNRLVNIALGGVECRQFMDCTMTIQHLEFNARTKYLRHDTHWLISTLPKFSGESDRSWKWTFQKCGGCIAEWHLVFDKLVPSNN